MTSRRRSASWRDASAGWRSRSPPTERRGRSSPPTSTSRRAGRARCSRTSHPPHGGSLHQSEAPPFPEVPRASNTPVAGWPLGPTIPLRALTAYEECPRRFLYETVYGLRDEDPGYWRFHDAVYTTLVWAAEGAGR